MGISKILLKKSAPIRAFMASPKGAAGKLRNKIGRW
jgi:hypothetical protein